MPLSQPAEREQIHTRAIRCEGYRRADGLWDIEGFLVDTKTYDFDNSLRGTVAAGEPVHEMRIRLTIDETFVVRAVEAASDKHPFAPCPDITPAYKALVGTRIGGGWRKQVIQLVGREKGCTHLTRLLENLAVVAMQTLGPWLSRENRLPLPEGKKPPQIDGCHALRSDGQVVREHFPRWYRDGA